MTAQQLPLSVGDASGRVVTADCISVMRGLADATVPLIIADPPYGVGYHSNYYADRNPHAPITGDWNFQVGRFLSECSRVLIDGGALYLFCRWDVTPIWFPYVSVSNLKVKTVIVWVKNNWSAGDLDGSFGNQYEQLLFITKGRHILRGKRYPNVWQFARVPAKKLLHPAQKPVALIERAILASSDEGDLVLDPFCGSGSTGEACINTGRSYLLSDIDKRMVAIANKRLGLPTVEMDEDGDMDEEMLHPLYLPEPPEWCVHPDELHAIYTMIQENVGTL